MINVFQLHSPKTVPKLVDVACGLSAGPPEVLVRQKWTSPGSSPCLPTLTAGAKDVFKSVCFRQPNSIADNSVALDHIYPGLLPTFALCLTLAYFRRRIPYPGSFTGIPA